MNKTKLRANLFAVSNDARNVRFCEWMGVQWTVTSNMQPGSLTKALRCNGFVDGPNSAGSFYVLSYLTLLWKTCFKCPSREIHSPSGFAVNSNQQRITSSLLSPNTKKAGTDSFSSIPALKPRYPLDNTSFFGCQLFRFRNKISFFGSFAFSYPLCFYYLVVCWFILQEHLFLFLISICLPAFLW